MTIEDFFLKLQSVCTPFFSLVDLVRSEYIQFGDLRATHDPEASSKSKRFDMSLFACLIAHSNLASLICAWLHHPPVYSSSTRPRASFHQYVLQHIICVTVFWQRDSLLHGETSGP